MASPALAAVAAAVLAWVWGLLQKRWGLGAQRGGVWASPGGWCCGASSSRTPHGITLCTTLHSPTSHTLQLRTPQPHTAPRCPACTPCPFPTCKPCSSPQRSREVQHPWGQQKHIQVGQGCEPASTPCTAPCKPTGTSTPQRANSRAPSLPWGQPQNAQSPALQSLGHHQQWGREAP